MKKRLLPIAVILLLTLPLALLLQGFVRDVLLVGLWRLYVGTRLLFESLPQSPIWQTLAAILLVIALRSLIRRRRRLPQKGEVEAAYQGRVQVWTEAIQRTPQGEYFRWSLARRLGELTWDVMGYQTRTSPEQVKQRFEAGRLELAPEIRAYLQFSQQQPSPGSSTSGPGWAGLLARIRDRFGIGAPPSLPAPDLERPIAVVQLLEEQLDARLRQAGLEIEGRDDPGVRT